MSPPENKLLAPAFEHSKTFLLPHQGSSTFASHVNLCKRILNHKDYYVAYNFSPLRLLFWGHPVLARLALILFLQLGAEGHLSITLD